MTYLHRSPDGVREIRHFHLFCGLGGGAKGLNQAQPRVAVALPPSHGGV